jgi:hypothetical protein
MALNRRVYANYELRETWKREAMAPFITRPSQHEQTKKSQEISERLVKRSIARKKKT